LLWIVDSWQLDDDLIVAPRLDQRLAHAKTVHPALECLAGTFQRVSIKCLARDRARLQDDLEPALQIKTAVNRMRSPETADVEI
jgi:hypothetical protein